jgi:DNA-binding transcriptional LysR family regulator
MHLRFVEIFCEVAARRSFSKGALAHAVSQSSASQAVLALERRLGARLIDRSKRPLELTAAGRIYFDGCRELLDRLRSVEDRVRATRDLVAGGVKVAAIYSVNLMQMGRYVQRFEKLYPDAALKLDYLHPDQVYQQVRGDEADLGLVSFPRRRGEFAVIPWQEQPMVLVAPPRHSFAGRRAVDLADLHGQPMVGFTPELTIRREIDRWLRQAGAVARIVHEFDNIEMIKKSVQAGSGVALLPEPTVWSEVASHALVAVPLQGRRYCRPLGIVHKRGRQLSLAARKFVALLLEDQRVDGAEAAALRTGQGARRRSANGRAANGRAVSRRPALAGQGRRTARRNSR